MTENIIFRDPTIQERQNFRIIGEKDWVDLVRKRLVQIQQKYTELHKPFCYTCACIDCFDRVESVKKELARNINPNSDTIKVIEDIGIDFEEVDKKYSKEDRFYIIGKVKKELQPNRLNPRLQIQTGWETTYKCKIRNCNNSVTIPIEVEEEIMMKKK